MINTTINSPLKHNTAKRNNSTLLFAPQLIQVFHSEIHRKGTTKILHTQINYAKMLLTPSFYILNCIFIQNFVALCVRQPNYGKHSVVGTQVTSGHSRPLSALSVTKDNTQVRHQNTIQRYYKKRLFARTGVIKCTVRNDSCHCAPYLIDNQNCN